MLQRCIRLIQGAFGKRAPWQEQRLNSLAKAEAVPWQRWDKYAFTAAKLHLESLKPEELTQFDRLLAAEYIVQHYLPDGVINTNADYITVKAALLGKISAGGSPLPPDALGSQEAMTASNLGNVPAKVLTPLKRTSPQARGKGNGEAGNQGFIASAGLGSRVRWLEPYQGACAFCQWLNGKVFTIVPADKPNKDIETEIWVGKAHICRPEAGIQLERVT
jgi:hypothetical protein